MWSDLNMHDRHKLIRLAVTNGVYDLDTIRSLYDNNEYKDGGNMRIAPYKDNASYPDRKLYRNVKRDFRKDPEAEYKDYDEYGVRVYNPSLFSNAHNRKERQEAMLERIRQDFPEIQKNDVKKTAFKSNNIGWGDSIVDTDRRTLYGLQQEYDFVNNIVPYGKLGMDTPENIRRKEELERKNRNTTFDYTNNFDLGGDLQTEPNRTLPSVDRTIEMLRMKALEKALMEQSQNIPNVIPVNNAIAYNYVKPYVAPQSEVVNLANVLNKKNYTDIKRTIPVAEAGPIFINTYKDGGNTGNPPYDWTKAWQQEANKQTTTQPTGKYNVVATDGKNSNYNYGKNVTPDLSWYKDPLENTRMVTEEPIEPLYGFKDPVFNVALLGAGLANGIGNDILGSATKATMEGLSKPITTIASQIPQLSKYSYMMPTLDKALWATTGASGLYNRVSDEGIQGITNHPFLTAMDLGMLSPVAKGIKTVGNEAMWKYIPSNKSITQQKIKSSISPKEQSWTSEQWTAAQDAAIESGDMAEAQRLRDLHFGLSNSKYKEPLFRGTDEDSPIMDLSKMQVNDIPAVYLTPYEGYARQYGDNVRKLYLNTQNPWIDKFGKDYSRLSIDRVKKSLEKAIQKGDNTKIEKYRGILNDIEGTDAAYRYRIDGVNGDLTKIYEGTPPEILGRDVNKVKSADAVTYDNNGVRIPLGLRDNFKLNDIRYGLTTLGTTGLGLGLGYPFLKNYEQ